MARSFVVLWGQTGKKNFRKLSNAKTFAGKKANKTGKTVEIDTFRTFPKARVGETDWIQGHHSFVRPRRRR